MLPFLLCALAAPVAHPASEARALLGRYLFYDQRLSANGTQSCATCHRQELAFTDGRATAIGATGHPHPRAAMSLVNVAASTRLTWINPELRSLEKQALIPMFGEHPVEMGVRRETLLRLLRSEPVYRGLFPKAFPESENPFTVLDVTKAIAGFERTIVSARSPYDRYHRGGERDAISEAAKRGEVLFFTDPVAGCFRCHSGPDFTDGQYHNTALYLGDARKFKTPSLRNIELTGPYMHDGSVATLEQAIDHYAAGGRARANPNKDRRLTGFRLTPQNRDDLVAFLKSLSDTELLHDARFSNPWDRKPGRSPVTGIPE